MDNSQLYWADLAFSSKKPLRELDATFIAAPRELSPARLTQLVKEYLPSGNIVIGCALEPYIDGFEGQPQFKTLQAEGCQGIVTKVNASKSPHKITILHYSQRDITAIYGKISFRQVVLINGSWQYSFHTRPEYYTLVSQKTPFVFVSPFVDEAEAKDYATRTQLAPLSSQDDSLLTEFQMMDAASIAAKSSFDSAFQTGTSLGRRQKDGSYALIATSFNKVVPYQTFAWHFGPSRERHLSPPGDLNHYDAVHAEVMLLIEAQKQTIDLKGTTLFINLLPCPTCARMFSAIEIGEFVYSLDHSNGYAVAMLEKAGKVVRRVVNINNTV